MKRTIVIGGGASGLISAIFASSKTNEVIILERNGTCGKKILATGGGKCNYWNANQDLKYYHSDHERELKKIITKQNQQEVLNFFQSLGIIPKIKNGYYYPFSNQAVTIQNALILECQKRKITIKNHSYVKKIERSQEKFIVTTTEKVFFADSVILATGSKAAPKTGSDGNGYLLAKSLGHTIIEPLPALVQIETKGSYLKEWVGIRTDAILTWYENGQRKMQEIGELQLTAYGISGICSMNLSRYISKGIKNGKKEKIKINFLPFLSYETKEQYLAWLESQNHIVQKRTIQELLEAILNYKLVRIILKEANIPCNKNFQQLSLCQKEDLITHLIEWSVEITGTKSFMDAQVCSGGIPLTEINPYTMESKKQKGLYLIGELLDVDGSCGGYNLGFAWMSGMLAGKSCKGEKNDTN